MRKACSRIICLLPVLALLVWAGPAVAVRELPGELLGRRNPYKPLIMPGTSQPLPNLPAPNAPDVRPAALPAPVSALERLQYVGIAYDEAEAIAAVSNGERTWFVRMGDRLDGAVVSAITPHKLTWTRGGRPIVKHLRRESGAK